MRIKLDENLGQRGAELLRRHGHDVATVNDQRLCSAADRELIDVCRNESRCLVTLDLDFGNPLRFDPSEFSGIAVLRLPSKSQPSDVLNRFVTLAKGLETDSIDQRLWIVEENRIRKYQPLDI